MIRVLNIYIYIKGMELHNSTFWFFGFELGLFNLTIFFLKIVQERMDPNGPGGYSNRIRVTHVEICYAIWD